MELVIYPKNNDYTPLLEFQEDGFYVLSLDINSCGGGYHLLGDGIIECSTVACTKMCCDSQFSQKLVVMLPQIQSFAIEGQTLKLNVPDWGWIELSRVSD